MSKFLKFIVHFIVICTIVCVVGLAVPPFLGITTEIMDDSGKETNLPMHQQSAVPVPELLHLPFFSPFCIMMQPASEDRFCMQKIQLHIMPTEAYTLHNIPAPKISYS